ncbi:MAG TPA: HAMP domain-containing histidine kinase [Bacteroidetes bacterium]|nr:HAMP domain-containing histidine kinase [Bacteroidota bacterium]
MRGGLRTRWTLALVTVCVLEAALVAVAVRVSTARTFDRFVVAESFDAFVRQVEAEAQSTGAVSATPPAAQAAPPDPPAGRPEADPIRDRPPGPRPPRRGGRGGVPPPASLGRGIAFGLADADGRVVQPFDAYASGDVLPPEALARGRAVTVGDERVGTAFVPEDAMAALAEFPPTSPEARFLTSSTTALLAALGLALAVSIAVGLWLASRTVRPLRRLTEAARGLAVGDLGRTVTVERADEVGALAEAFNAMSAQLAEATALRKQMTADVSHDLRTPVTTVLGTLELIESGALEPTPERIGAARAQAERLARLVEDFHTLALADAGALPVHPTRVSPADALRQTVAAFEARATEAGVGLAVEADAPDVRADPDRLAQILDNLVANALRHTPAGGGITLSAREAPEGVEITVADTGEGIPADALPHVFERSVRADGARSGGGAGLGLSIVRSLAQAMGGSVSAVSAPGAGTTVTVSLLRWA